MSQIFFESMLIEINSIIMIKLPIKTSNKLPSRGMVMVKGIINDIDFQVALEPDGKRSHWFEVSEALQESAKIKVGSNVSISIEPLNIWSEPEVPNDILNSINANGLLNQWNNITTKARWDWIRWIQSTANIQTRQKRIEVACSKLKAGDRNPCCFDRNRCSITSVSKNGMLIDPKI